MTLTEAVLKSTGCTKLTELPEVPVERKKQLAKGLLKIEAGQVRLEEWNLLLTAFGYSKEQTQSAARERLIRSLYSGTDTAVGTARSPAPAPQQTPQKEAEPKQSTVSPQSAASRQREQSGAKKTLMRIWNIFTSLLVVAAVALAVTLVGVRLVGFQVFTVLSGSMEPVYHVGALIYVKEIDPADLAVGDDITFMLDEDTVATHRIIEVVPDENDPETLRFRTKGVANEHEDGSLVHYKNVIGKPVFTIPLLGYLANYIQNPPGMYIAIAAGAVLILLVFLPDLFSSEEEEEAPEKKKKRARKT